MQDGSDQTLIDRRDPGNRDIAALAVAVAGYALAFGAVAATAGMSVRSIFLMSLLANSGGAQFAFVGALTAGAAGATATASALVVNLRLALYGTAVQQHFRQGGWRRAVATHLIGDENVALATSASSPDLQRKLFWTAGIALYAVWVGTTTIGAWIGSTVSDPTALGLDAVFPAAFVGLLYPMLMHPRGRFAAATAALVTLVATPIVAPGIPLVVAALVGATAASRLPMPEADDAR